MLPLATSLAEAVLAVGKQLQPSESSVTDASEIDILFWGYGALCKVLLSTFSVCLQYCQPFLSQSAETCSSPALTLRQTVDYVLAALRMRRPDEAEKLLLFQRCLPALMECRMYLSTAPTRLPCDEKQAFARMMKGDVDLAYGFSSVMEKASLCRVCPAMRSCPRCLAGRWSWRPRRCPKCAAFASAQALEIAQEFTLLAMEGHGEALEASEQEQGLSWKQALVRLIGSSSISGCLRVELERTSKLTGADLAGENQPQLPFPALDDTALAIHTYCSWLHGWLTSSLCIRRQGCVPDMGARCGACCAFCACP